jgi:hypothetical protein
MNKSVKKWLRIILLIAFISATYVYSAFIFAPKSNYENEDYYKERSFLAENDKSVEVFCIGNSNLKYGINPLSIYDKYGFTSYNSGEDGQTLENAFTLFKIAVTKQDIKELVIETDLLFSLPKLYYQKSKGDNFIEHIFTSPFFYHKRWTDLEISDFCTLPKEEYNRSILKGYYYSKYITSAKYSVGYTSSDSVDSATLVNSRLNHLKEIIEFAKKKSIDITFITTPCYQSTIERHNAVKKIAKEYSCGFIDFNLRDMIYSTGFKTSEDFDDCVGIHLNFIGAKLISNYLADYLSSKNILKNFKKDIPKNELWESSLSYFKSL